VFADTHREFHFEVTERGLHEWVRNVGQKGCLQLCHPMSMRTVPLHLET
jgi:hypothetical protein